MMLASNNFGVSCNPHNKSFFLCGSDFTIRCFLNGLGGVLPLEPV